MVVVGAGVDAGAVDPCAAICNLVARPNGILEGLLFVVKARIQNGDADALASDASSVQSVHADLRVRGMGRALPSGGVAWVRRRWLRWLRRRTGYSFSGADPGIVHGVMAADGAVDGSNVFQSVARRDIQREAVEEIGVQVATLADDDARAICCFLCSESGEVVHDVLNALGNALSGKEGGG